MTSPIRRNSFDTIFDLAVEDLPCFDGPDADAEPMEAFSASADALPAPSLVPASPGPAPAPPESAAAGPNQRLHRMRVTQNALQKQVRLSEKRVQDLTAEVQLLQTINFQQGQSLETFRRVAESDALTITFLRAQHVADKACFAMYEGHMRNGTRATFQEER